MRPYKKKSIKFNLLFYMQAVATPPCGNVYVKTAYKKLLKILVFREFGVFFMNSRFFKNRNHHLTLYNEHIQE